MSLPCKLTCSLLSFRCLRVFNDFSIGLSTDKNVVKNMTRLLNVEQLLCMEMTEVESRLSAASIFLVRLINDLKWILIA